MIIVFDSDHSMATLGGPEQVTKLFGIPPIKITQGFPKVKDAFEKLFTSEIQKFEHPIIGEYEERVVKLIDSKNEMGVTHLVIDTLSSLVAQEVDRLSKTRRKGGGLFMDDWGDISRDLNRILVFLRTVELPVILTCHIKMDKDDQTGAINYLPNIPTATKFDVGKYFDAVLTTKVQPKGKSYEYLWNAAGGVAKSRGGVLGDELIKQDFSHVFQAFRNNGYEYPKILVLGAPGTGKTKSLDTIKDGKE